MLRRLLRLATNPFFLALVFTAAAYPFLPRLFDPYRLEILRENRSHQYELYEDLDGDGQNERLIFRYYNQLVPQVEIRGPGGEFRDIQNFTGTWADPYYGLCMTGDYNGDGTKEIVTFTHRNDSVFVNWFDVRTQSSLTGLFVTTVQPHSGGRDYCLHPAGLTDTDGDGLEEYVFAINAGYPLQPRRFYALNVVRGAIHTSPDSYAKIVSPFMADVDGDGRNEILFTCGASENVPDTAEVPFHDHSAWFMVLDHDLRFLFPPVEFRGKYNLQPVVLGESEPVIWVFARHLTNAEAPNRILRFSPSGEALDTLSMEPCPVEGFRVQSLPGDNAISIITEDRTLFRLDDGGSFTRIVAVQDFLGMFAHIDLDGDGRPEWLGGGFSDELIVVDEARRNTLRIDLSGNGANTRYQKAQFIRREGRDALLHVQFDDYHSFLRYKYNPLYPFRHLLVLAVYAGFFGIVFISQRLQQLRDRRARELQEQVRDLQVRAALSQLDPHFAFNVINAVGGYIMRNEREQAYNYLADFARLIRVSLENADSLTWSLAEELDFVRRYVSLQQLRFPDLFEFQCDCEESEAETLEVPKMLVQHCAENAIKHGLRARGGGGVLEIALRPAGPGWEITVSDNGIGRRSAAASRTAEGAGKGQQIIAQLIHFYNQRYSRKLTLAVEDLEDGAGGAKGTRVRISLL